MYGQNKTNVLGEPRRIDELLEVPNTATLTKRVRTSMIGCHQSTPKKSCDFWNEMFQQIVTECDLKKYYPADVLLECYNPGNSCGHILRVELDENATNTLQLTTLESVASCSFSYSLRVATSFVYAIIFHNPVWDLGLQFAITKLNSERIFNMKKECSKK